MPPPQHFTNRKDSVRLDSVQDPTLVFARFIQLLPESEVRRLAYEMLVYTTDGGCEETASERFGYGRRGGKEDRGLGTRKEGEFECIAKVSEIGEIFRG